MPQAQADPLIEYHIRRLRYLIVPAIIVNIYYAFFLYYVYSSRFISRSETEFVRPSMSGPLAFQLIILFLLLLGAVLRTVFFRSAGATGNFTMLASATTLFILTICGPVYFWGGSHKSVFGPLLATVAGLTVIVAQTRTVRLIFGLFCVVLFTYFSLPLHYQEIFPVRAAISEVSPLTGDELYARFQTIAAVATICIVFLLTWRHAQDRTIFGDDAKSHVLHEHTTTRARTEMVQSSIKFVVDIRNKVLAGGGQDYLECLDKLEAELKQLGQNVNRNDVWCADWSPATDELVKGTLRSISDIEAATSANSEIQFQVTDIAKSILGKRKHDWRQIFKR